MIVMKENVNMRLSILDYVPIFEGSDTTQAINHSVELAQLAESLGFYRFWVAEHHKVLSVASSAPEMIMMALLKNDFNTHWQWWRYASPL